MAIKLKHSDCYNMYFITFTCYNWMHLFEITNAYDIVYKWFSYLRTNKIAETISYVIMPNHLHCILYFENETFDLNKIVGNGKRFLAYEIIKRLKTKNESNILYKLTTNVTEKEKKKGQLHKVFKTSFDAKPIFTEKFLRQKLAYIDYNPISGNWQLVADYVDYLHSSASYYEIGLTRFFEPLHFESLNE